MRHDSADWAVVGIGSRVNDEHMRELIEKTRPLATRRKLFVASLGEFCVGETRAIDLSDDN